MKATWPCTWNLAPRMPRGSQLLGARCVTWSQTHALLVCPPTHTGGLRLGPGLSQNLGSLLRMGGRKALHFLSAHTGVLPKSLVDKGSRALGSGLRRQDTDHRVGGPSPLASES